jgi:hypothetical protein
MGAALEDLMAAETRLSRSFAGYVMAVVSSVLWAMFLSPTVAAGNTRAAGAALLLLAAQICLFIWYAVSAGAAARVLGDAGWKYVVWILVAPFVALVPIPIVSSVIAVSPLSIKFLLGGQLQSAIRSAGVAGLRG